MRIRNLLPGALIATTALLASACGSGAGVATPTPSSTSTPTPVPTATATPIPTEPATLHVGVYFVSRDGSVLRRLVDGEVFRADLSPDGTEVIYARDNQVLATDIETGSTRIVTTAPAAGYIYTPTWSATGRYITFPMDEERGLKSTWLVRRDGSGMRQLFAEDQRALYVRDWLPDDSAALAISDRLVEYGQGPDLPPWHVFRVTPDGAISDPLAEFQMCYCGGDPAFRVVVSPDGSRIAYSDATSDVHMLNVDGTGYRNLTQSPEEEDWLIGWADDRSVVYGTHLAPPYRTPFRLDVVDGSVTPVPFSLAVSPDGSVVRDLVWFCHAPTDLIVQTPDGRETDLLDDRIPGNWYLSGAQWLPDGSGIVFTVTQQDVCT